MNSTNESMNWMNRNYYRQLNNFNHYEIVIVKNNFNGYKIVNVKIKLTSMKTISVCIFLIKFLLPNG